MNSELDELFLKRMKSMRKEELTNMLRCNLCEGLFRFAHTIVDCGHTFCQVCIFNYIRRYKGRNPSIKCPQCHIPVESNYKRSIIRDIFKQTLVDTLAPQYAREDQVIVKRVQELFPEFQLEFIFEEFKFATFEMPNRTSRKQPQPNISSKLIQKIRQKFNITFQTFCEMITTEQNFLNLKTLLQSGPSDPRLIEIKPKTERDYTFIGINNQMKAATLNVVKIQRFIEKRALEKINKTDLVPAEWRTSCDDKLNIKIYLELNGREILQADDLEHLLAVNRGFPIVYSLAKPNE